MLVPMAFTVDAANVAQGTCGEGMTWTLDDMGTLSIHGSGIMDIILCLPNSLNNIADLGRCSVHKNTYTVDLSRQYTNSKGRRNQNADGDRNLT